MADPNPYKVKRASNAHGKLYEKGAAKRLNARLTPNSGAVQGFSGDMTKQAKHDRYLIEAKTTDKQTLSLDLAWLVKISEEALAKGMVPALLFSFVLPNGRPSPIGETEWVAMPLSKFNELTG